MPTTVPMTPHPRSLHSGVIEFESPAWDEISSDAKNIISGLLTLDPAARLTAAAALDHPWLDRAAAPEPGAPSAPLRDLPRRLSRHRLFRADARRNLRPPRERSLSSSHPNLSWSQSSSNRLIHRPTPPLAPGAKAAEPIDFDADPVFASFVDVPDDDDDWASPTAHTGKHASVPLFVPPTGEFDGNAEER